MAEKGVQRTSAGPEPISSHLRLPGGTGWWIAAARLPLHKDIWVNKAINLQPTQGQGQDKGPWCTLDTKGWACVSRVMEQEGEATSWDWLEL